jgi:8-oxo-dGTP diphosphatase
VSGTLLVVAGALEKDGRLLLTRRLDDDPLAGLWELPGGKVESGENPVEALAREWREELGVRVEEAEPLAFASVPNGGRHLTLLVFRVLSLAGDPAPVGVAEVRWASPDEAALLPLLPADRPLVERLPRDGRGRFSPGLAPGRET